MNAIISFIFTREFYLDWYYYDFKYDTAESVKRMMLDSFVIDDFIHSWGEAILKFLPIIAVIAILVAVITTVVVIRKNKKES